MQMTIRFSGGSRADFGEFNYERVMHKALERFQHLLKQVQLYIEDTNGPRGGVDKQCRCVLHLRRMQPVVIQDQDESVGPLIHRVAERASYALSKKSDRKKRNAKGATKISQLAAIDDSEQA